MSADKKSTEPIVTATPASSILSDGSDSTKPSSAAAGRNLADPALKWGITPPSAAARQQAAAAAARPESSYSAEEQAARTKLRAKGINPDLKAEMDAKVYGNGKGGIWNKVAGTTFGGGLIK